MFAALLSIGVPVALLALGSGGDVSEPALIAMNLGIMALPHCLVWWFAARRGESRSAEFYGGLVGANAVLAFYASNDMELLWIFYWPLAAIGVVVGHLITERIVVQWRRGRTGGEA